MNIVAFWILHRGRSENLNVRGALLHVLGDMLGSVGAIVAALIILWTGWTPIDPILSVAVVLLILRSAWKVTKESGHILLEGTPDGIDPPRIGDAVRAIAGVIDVHHVHAWSLTNERRMVTLHAVIARMAWTATPPWSRSTACCASGSASTMPPCRSSMADYAHGPNRGDHHI